MRTALRGLTTRGRSFLAAGIAAGVCAYVLGQSDLLRVGVLLAVLPLVCAAVLYRTRHQVAAARRLTPRRVAAGEEARVHLRLDNVSRVTTGLLMLQDQVPYVLGPRPRFVLERVEAGGRREVSYRVRSDLRGRYPLGPLQLRLSDPFGMCELTRAFSAHDDLIVVPRTEPLPPVRLAGDGAGYGDGRQRSLALAGEDDVIPRGYRHGDDLRRVHWRSTARHGELMVRREEQPQRARCTVLLDTRRTAYRGAGPGSAFEWAVSGAASAVVHMLGRGFAVRLLTDEGNALPSESVDGFAAAAQDSAEAAGLMLDTLAVLDHSEGSGLSRAYDALRGGGEGLLVAFVGDLDEEQAAVAARMRHRGGGAVAFVLDSGAWAHGGTGGHALAERLRTLNEAGWSAVAVPPGAALAELWRHLGPGGLGGQAVSGPAASPASSMYSASSASSASSTAGGPASVGSVPGGTRGGRS
ncbi:DUF58 domain-containing protein [Streptomyces sp. NPDC047097]|uniref:DUF58 domain-containing protein n=1 Tax=Streptomyces sp. NPDC047097 TaxID=3155260 RepID=UPI0033CFE7F3